MLGAGLAARLCAVDSKRRCFVADFIASLVLVLPLTRHDMDELTGLPLAFGKQARTKKPTDTKARFDTTKRTSPPPPAVRPLPLSLSGSLGTADPVHALQLKLEHQDADADADAVPGRSNPAAASTSTPSPPTTAPAADADADQDDLPVTHEVILKDHLKVRPPSPPLLLLSLPDSR